MNAEDFDFYYGGKNIHQNVMVLKNFPKYFYHCTVELFSIMRNHNLLL